MSTEARRPALWAMLQSNRRIQGEIAQLYRDVRYWNEANPRSAPIAPDPDGMLADMLAQLEHCEADIVAKLEHDDGRPVMTFRLEPYA